MGRTSHFPFLRKNNLPQTTNTHLIAEKPPPGQRPVTLSKAERILGTAGHINVDGGAAGRIRGGQGAPWDGYRMAGGAERQTHSSESGPVNHEDDGNHMVAGQPRHGRDIDHMEETMQSRNRLEDDAYHDNLRSERASSVHSKYHSHQPSHQQWQDDDLGDLLPPRKHGLATRASSTLLGSSFGNEVEEHRDLRQEKSSSTLRSYHGRPQVPPSTSSSSGKRSQLRKMENSAPEPLRSPHSEQHHHDVETLAAAEMRAATMRDQMRREGKKPEKKASRLNIGRLFGGKEKKRKDVLEGFVMQDPRQMQHHQQRKRSLPRVTSVDMSRVPNNGPSRNHAGMHDLYEHYESRAFDTAPPSISEEDDEYQPRHDNHIRFEDASRGQREEEVSPKAHRNALQSHAILQPQPAFSSPQQSHSHQTSPGDLHAFRFPAPTDPLATARRASKQKIRKPAVTSIFPAPYVPPILATNDPNPHSAGLGGYPSPSQMRRLSGTPPSAPPNTAPPLPPALRRTNSGSGPSPNSEDDEELQKGYARRHWDNGSTHSSATGVSKSSKKSIFSSSNLAQTSVLSFSSDSDSDVEARFEEEKRRIRDQESRPKTSDEQDRKDMHGHSVRSKEHQRKRSSTISTPAPQFSQDGKYLTIPLPSPTSNRLSGPWQPLNLALRDKERDSGSTIRGGLSLVDKRMSSSTTASGMSTLSTSSAQSCMSAKSMHSNGNGRLSSYTLSSVAESGVHDSEHDMAMLDTAALSNPRMPPPMGPVPPRPKKTDSKSRQGKSAKSAGSTTPSIETLREGGSNRSDSRSESRSERKKSIPDASRGSGNLMQVTPQELALLSALRNKRQRMRDEILAEAEFREAEGMDESDAGELNVRMKGFEFPAPPSEGRRTSTATVSTIKSLGALTHPHRDRDRSESRDQVLRSVSRTRSIGQGRNNGGSAAPSRVESTTERILQASRRENMAPGHSLSPAPQRREHTPQGQTSQPSKPSYHERAESDTLDGVEVPSSNSTSRSHSLASNPRHPKANDERENAMNGRLRVPFYSQPRTGKEAAQPSPDLSDFLSFGSDDDTPRSSWNNGQLEDKKETEFESRRMARLSAFGPHKMWGSTLVGEEDQIVEDDSFEDSEGEAILREWGSGAF